MLFILAFVLFRNVFFAQVRVSDEINRESISSVLKAWSEEYDVDFAFDSYELSGYVFTGVFRDEDLDVALVTLLAETPFRFKWMRNTCIVYPVSNASLNFGESKKNEQKIVTGEVRDRLSGESLPFASVSAINSGLSATADEDGRFTFVGGSSSLADTLVIFFLGYETYKVPFTWTDVPDYFTVKLARANALLPDVEIRSTNVKPIRFEKDVSALHINPNLSGILHGVGEADITREVQLTPGISGVQENNNGLFVRGSSSDQCQLLFDGFTVYHQDHFMGMFSAMNAHAVKSMRMHACVTDPSQGGRTAGTLELIGREGDLRNPSGRLEMGTMSISGSFETPLDTTGKASLFLSGRRSITEWLKGPAYKELYRTLYSASIVSPQSDFERNSSAKFDPQLLFQDVNAKLTYRPSPGSQFNVSFYASRDDVAFAYADTTKTELVNVADVRYSDDASKLNRGASLRWNYRVSPAVDAFTSVGFSAFEGRYFSADTIRINLFATDSVQFTDRNVLLQDWSVLHHWQLRRSRHALKFGLALNHVAIMNKTRTVSEALQAENNSGYVAALFIGDEWNLSRWNIKPGLRVNRFFENGASLQFEPKLSVRYRLLGERLFMKAAVVRTAQFVQRISNQSLYQNVPDQWQLAGSDFPVMTSDQAVLGLNWTGEHWNVDLEGYVKQTQGQLLNAAAGQYTNQTFNQYYVGELKAAGVDVAVQWQKAAHRIMCAVSRIYSSSDYEGFESKQVVESYIRDVEAKLVYEWRSGPWSASVLLIGSSGAPFTSLAGLQSFNLPDGSSRVFPLFAGYNRDRTTPYQRADVAGSYQWQWNATKWRAAFSIYNLFDANNYKAIQYSVGRNEPGSVSVQKREIRMLGRIPSLTLSCQF
jgi:outer membrane receptor for ferrienterochelin and colicin